ncbi:MAG: glycosyltransferase, partial [Candidatus Omnitrophica bacterium]|nr:glycosyltransferase [Candidatus Omnitrophota bacterium]
MNILLITNHLNVGGITSYCLTLAGGLKKMGHQVFIASSGGDKVEAFKQGNIRFIPVPLRTKQEIHPKLLVSALRLASLIKKEKIEVVHTHSRTTQVVGCLLARYTK